MKKLYKATVLAALGLASVSAVQATSYTQGDLLIGFTVSSGNDLVYDLGQESTLFAGETWDLSSLLTGYNLNSVNWGVIGDTAGTTPRTVWTTTAGGLPNTVNNNTAFNSLNSAAGTMIQFAGPASSSAGVFTYSDSTQDYSWNMETMNGALTTAYHNAYENPNVTGLTSDTLWAVPVGASATPVALGNFSLSGAGTVTFSPVPEPASYGLLSAAGLLTLVFRNRFSSRRA